MSIRIRAVSAKGFRRCGILHTAEPVLYPDQYFSEEELSLLKAEPQLVVEEFHGLADEAHHLKLERGEAAADGPFPPPATTPSTTPAVASPEPVNAVAPLNETTRTDASAQPEASTDDDASPAGRGRRRK